MKHIEMFAMDLHQEVLAKACREESPQMREDAFTEVVLERLADHNDVAAAEVCHFSAVGRGRLAAAKLNAYGMSGDGATVDLFVSFYHGEGDVQSIGRAEVNEHFRRLRGFLRRSLEGHHVKLEESNGAYNVSPYEVSRQIFEASETLATARLFFLTDYVVKPGAIEQEEFPGLEVAYEVWDLEKLSRLKVGEREIIRVDFAAEHGGAISCIATPDGTNEYTTYLAFVPAPVLSDIYARYGQRLLERNVRAFLQAKGKVNRGLQQTLKEEPHRFLAYNNGLCCTASAVDHERLGNGHVRIRAVTDLQIVNGGQTTASIFHAIRKEKTDISKVQVQMKLTVMADPSRIADVVPLISRFANSQNKVNAADFSANGRFHQELERLSRTVWTPPLSGLDRGSHWYYERARGSYMDDKNRQGSPGKIREWVVANPIDQKFTKTDVAKYEHAWLGFPHLVCRGAEKNFLAMAERHDEEGEPIMDLNGFRHIVSKAILFKAAEKQFSDAGLEGYRANSVAYAVSWLVRRSGWRIPLDRIWDRQRVPEVLRVALSSACKAAHAHLLGAAGNVGEYSKKEECWRRFQDVKLHLAPGWESELEVQPIKQARTESERIAAEWENVRRHLIDDNRTMEGLENFTGLAWVSSRRRDPVASFASKSFEELRKTEKLPPNRIADLVRMFSIVVADSKGTGKA